MDKMFARHGYPLSLRTDNGTQFVSKEFESFLDENGVEHRRTTPLWPQANGEVERQNRTLLKAMKIAHAQGKDWKRELNKFLLAYRTTVHITTGVSPAELMFGRVIRSKMPEFREGNSGDLSARDKDAEMKQKGKDYADQRRHAKDSDVYVGDKVLVQQHRQNKLSTRYANNPFTVVNRNGSQVTVESPSGIQYKRNVGHVRKFHSDLNETGNGLELSEMDSPGESVELDDDEVIDNDDKVDNQQSVETPIRPVRERRRPVRFQDYSLN